MTIEQEKINQRLSWCWLLKCLGKLRFSLPSSLLLILKLGSSSTTARLVICGSQIIVEREKEIGTEKK